MGIWDRLTAATKGRNGLPYGPGQSRVQAFLAMIDRLSSDEWEAVILHWAYMKSRPDIMAAWAASIELAETLANTSGRQQFAQRATLDPTKAVFGAAFRGLSPRVRGRPVDGARVAAHPCEMNRLRLKWPMVAAAVIIVLAITALYAGGPLSDLARHYAFGQ